MVLLEERHGELGSRCPKMVLFSLAFVEQRYDGVEGTDFKSVCAWYWEKRFIRKNR